MLKIEQVKENIEAIVFCETFLSKKSIPKYIFGINEYARSIAEKIKIDGFVDDFRSEKMFLNRPIIKTDDIPRDSMVVSVVVLGRNWTALNKLKEKKINAIDYYSFVKYSKLQIKEVDVFKDCKKDIENNLGKYEWIYSILEDDESKRIFNKIINFRVSGDLEYMKDIEFAQHRQYFEEFLNLKEGEVFVDAGGFEGETSIEFIRRCPNYKSVHISEPEPRNILKARENLKNYKNIYFYEKGLADKNKILMFGSGDGSSSKIRDTGNIDIHVDSMDSLIKEKVTFIKMDIEGSEGDAINGAKGHILSDHPKMAICIYHKPDDFWKIPEQIFAIRDDYEVYVRHYTEGIVETVMFFIPQTPP